MSVCHKMQGSEEDVIVMYRSQLVATAIGRIRIAPDKDNRKVLSVLEALARGKAQTSSSLIFVEQETTTRKDHSGNRPGISVSGITQHGRSGRVTPHGSLTMNHHRDQSESQSSANNLRSRTIYRILFDSRGITQSSLHCSKSTPCTTVVQCFRVRA